MNRCTVTLMLAWLPCCLPLAAQGGSIRGTLSAEDGTALPRALVTATRVGATPASASAIAATNGSFEITNLPAGTYALCAHAPGYVDPCRWSLRQTTVTLAAGQASAGNVLWIKRGSTLRVRLNDPGKVLEPQGAAPRHVLIGVFAQGVFQPASPASKDGSGANYELTIPRDTPLLLSIFSKQARLADGKGNPIPAGSLSQPFRHRTGDANPPVFTFTVVGPA